MPDKKHHRPLHVEVRKDQIQEPAKKPAGGAHFDHIESLEDRIAPSFVGGPGFTDDLPGEDPMAGDPQPGDDYTAPGEPPPETPPEAPPETPPDPNNPNPPNHPPV